MPDQLSVTVSRTELTTRPPADSALLVHRADPLNAETTLSTLNGAEITPSAEFYVRNHFPVPELDAAHWRLSVAGAVHHPLTHTLQDLRTMRSRTLVVTLECAGNNRTSFSPPVPGEQWRLGAASTGKWTGVPLNEILDRAQPTSCARNVVFRGADRGHIDGHFGPVFFERSLSIDEITESGALLAYQMNGAPLSREHGYPLRLIVPGWYGVASVKWLTDIDVVDHDFEGYFQVQRYRYTWLRDGHVGHRARAGATCAIDRHRANRWPTASVRRHDHPRASVVRDRACLTGAGQGRRGDLAERPPVRATRPARLAALGNTDRGRRTGHHSGPGACH